MYWITCRYATLSLHGPHCFCCPVHEYVGGACNQILKMSIFFQIYVWSPSYLVGWYSSATGNWNFIYIHECNWQLYVWSASVWFQLCGNKYNTGI